MRTKQEQQLKEVRRGRPNQAQGKARHQAMPGKGSRKETTENRQPKKKKAKKRKKRKKEEKKKKMKRKKKKT